MQNICAYKLLQLINLFRNLVFLFSNSLLGNGKLNVLEISDFIKHRVPLKSALSKEIATRSVK